MDKIDLRTTDLTSENVEKIGELFPQVITEAVGDDGELHKVVDFDALRQELSCELVEGFKERYQFTWPGKQEAKLEARRSINKTLRPEHAESVDFDTTENLYIEGDNLDALKLLRNTYAGKIKMIYIDPPYNTGHDFIYDDDFSITSGEYEESSEDFESGGGRLVANPDSNGRFHSDWCSMIYSRLLLAKDLLTNEGSILISIDDGEVAQLRKICDEVFGERNFIANIIWEKADSPRMDAKQFSVRHDHILMYSKHPELKINWLEEDSVADHYNKVDQYGRQYYLKPLRTMGKNDAREDRPSLYFGITDPDGNEALPVRSDGTDGRWRWSKEKVATNSDKIEWVDGRNGWTPYYKIFADEQTERPPETIWFNTDVGSNRTSMKQIKELFGDGKVFDTPKPINLITRMLEISTNSEDLVMDFFSGSATTAHAVMKLNSENEGSRKFIVVQLPEETNEDSLANQAGYKTIAEIGKERIRRAGAKIKEEAGLLGQNLDIGFRVLRIDSSNFEDTYKTPDSTDQTSLATLAGNLKLDRSPEDLLFEVLPAFRIPLSAKIETTSIGGQQVFNVNDNQLLACFDIAVTTEVVEEIAKLKPVYAVFRDASFANDSAAANFEELFKTYSPDTFRKVV